MAEETRIAEAVSALNAALEGVSPYKIVAISPQDVKLLDDDKNARYMPRRVYQQLVENIRGNSNLASLPFLWKSGDEFICLSGNHRVMAARDAGVALILALYTDSDMSRQEQVAIQLSHNSLAGQDDPAKLTALWKEINALEWKAYSGLDDGLLKTFAPVKIQRIDESKLRFEELRLMFTQSEIGRIKEVMQALGASKHTCLMGRFEDFDRFFDVLLKFKESEEVLNTATAFSRMIDIVEEWLSKAEQYRAEQ